MKTAVSTTLIVDDDLEHLYLATLAPYNENCRIFTALDSLQFCQHVCQNAQRDAIPLSLYTGQPQNLGSVRINGRTTLISKTSPVDRIHHLVCDKLYNAPINEIRRHPMI